MNAPGGQVSAARAAITLCVGILVLALVSLAAILGQAPPSAEPASAPASEFSAARAMDRLDRLLPEDEPHPVGSVENRRVRARLEAELRSLGLEPELERGRACNRAGACADVENVLAKMPGRRGGRAVVLAAHYDSVATSPGAADDGAGVAAVLEVARALRANQPLDSPVWLLFTDGEEAGMLGAELFAANRARLTEVLLVINLEARGVRGPSLMFEAGSPNLDLVRAFAASAERPVASSLFYAAYRSMPNDSDLTVFRRAGLRGLNFAFIGGAEHYHRASDDRAHLSRDSLQHQGDQVLSLARELGRGAPTASQEDAVFFDVAGRTLLVCSTNTARALTAVFATACLALLAWALRAGAVSPAALAAALFAWLGSIAFALLAGIVAAGALRPLGLLESPWPTHGGWIAVSLHGAALAGLFGSSALVGASLEPRSVLVVHALALQVFAIGFATHLPEALFTLLVPSAVLLPCVAAALASGSVRAFETAAVAGLAAHALIWAPIDRIWFDAVGIAAPALSAAAALILVLPLLALVAGLKPRVRTQLALIFAAQGVLVVGAVAVRS